jgi:hypothetical protein
MTRSFNVFLICSQHCFNGVWHTYPCITDKTLSQQTFMLHSLHSRVPARHRGRFIDKQYMSQAPRELAYDAAGTDGTKSITVNNEWQCSVPWCSFQVNNVLSVLQIVLVACSHILYLMFYFAKVRSVELMIFLSQSPSAGRIDMFLKLYIYWK